MFLDKCDQSGSETLWFWESPRVFVVIGYGQRADREVEEENCAIDGIPILRRCSGGGAVVQGPGCLNYGLALRIDQRTEIDSITKANRWIMNHNALALERLLEDSVAVAGHTDLVVQGRKVSGNAQRRRSRTLLFHGTFLCGLHFPWVDRYLKTPSLMPEYRRGRMHSEFIGNLEVGASQVMGALREIWGVGRDQEALAVDECYKKLNHRRLHE